MRQHDRPAGWDKAAWPRARCGQACAQRWRNRLECMRMLKYSSAVMLKATFDRAHVCMIVEWNMQQEAGARGAAPDGSGQMGAPARLGRRPR